MNWYLLLPPAFSIYLVLISRLFQGWLRELVSNSVFGQKPLDTKRSLVENIAEDWSDRVGFVNSMIVSLVTIFSIYSDTRSEGWAVATLVLLLAVFVPVFIWIVSHQIGELPATYTMHFNITHSWICRIILIAVNLVLLVSLLIAPSPAPSS